MNYQPIDLQAVSKWLESDSAGAVYQIIKSLLNDRSMLGDVMELSVFKLQACSPNRQRYVHFRQFKSAVDLGVLISDCDEKMQYDVISFCLMWQLLEHERQQGLLNMLGQCSSDRAVCEFFLFNPQCPEFFDNNHEFGWLRPIHAVDLGQMAEQLKQSGFEYIKYRTVYPKLSRLTNGYHGLLSCANQKSPCFEQLSGPIIQVTAYKQKPKMISLPKFGSKKAKQPTTVMGLSKQEKH